MNKYKEGIQLGIFGQGDFRMSNFWDRGRWESLTADSLAVFSAEKPAVMLSKNDAQNVEAQPRILRLH
jgi:hypothetical protein